VTLRAGYRTLRSSLERDHQTEPGPKLSGVNASAENQAQSKFNKAINALFWISVWSYAAVTALSSLAAPVGKFDDAIPLVHGMLVQQGSTPNVDFYSFYPPLNLYLNAAAFSILGRSVVAARVMADLFYIGVLLLTVWFFSSRYRSGGPLVPAAVLLVAASIGNLITMPLWPGLSLSLAALLTYLCSQNLHRYRLWAVVGSGILAALAMLSRINFGAYAAAVVVLDLLLQRRIDLSDRHDADSGHKQATLAAFGAPLVVCFCRYVYRHLWKGYRHRPLGIHCYCAEIDGASRIHSAAIRRRCC